MAVDTDRVDENCSLDSGTECIMPFINYYLIVLIQGEKRGVNPEKEILLGGKQYLISLLLHEVECMRLLVRFALAILLCLLLIIAYEYSNIRRFIVSSSDSKTDTDEVVRILLMSDDSTSGWEKNVNVTFNVIVVLIISLLTIALFVTGIIIVALTLDSSVIGSESDDLDETAIDSRQNQTVWAPHFFSSANRLLPQIDTITNLNKYSVSSVNEI